MQKNEKNFYFFRKNFSISIYFSLSIFSIFFKMSNNDAVAIANQTSSSVMSSLANSAVLAAGEISNTVLLRYMLQVLDNISIECSVKSIFRAISKTSAHLAGIFMIAYYLKNPDAINNPAIAMLKSLLYTEIEIPYIDTEEVLKRRSSGSNISESLIDTQQIRTLHYWLCDEIFKQESYMTSVNGFPIYRRRQGNVVKLSYIKAVHGRFIRKIYEDAAANLAKYLIDCTKIDTSLSIDIKQITNLNEIKMFPSWNYLKVTEQIRSFILVGRIFNNQPVLTLMIDGEPGLGKSRLAIYLAQQKLVSDVVVVNFLAQGIEKTFKDIIRVYSVKPYKGAAVIVIDEFDKWLDHHIDHAYNKYREETEKSIKESGGGGGGRGRGGKGEEEKGKSVPDVIIKDPYVQSKKEFACSLVSNILTQLQLMVDTVSIYPIVYIFCANNFSSIYRYATMHNNSLASRFTKVEFKRCQSDELKEYIRWFNSHLLELPDFHIEPEKLEKLLKEVVFEEFTYREIGIVFTHFLSNIPKIIEFFVKPDRTIFNSLNLEAEKKEFLEGFLSEDGSEGGSDGGSEKKKRK